MGRVWLLLLPLLAWCQGQPEFSVDSRLVQLSVGVSSKDRNISGLQQEDFVVLDNGRPQQIVGFQAEALPLDLILLVDVSTSLSESFERLRSLAVASTKQLRPEDRVGIIAFACKRLLVLPPTFDHILASAELKLLQGSVPCTELNRNLVESARYLTEVARLRSQAAILIFSDNTGWSSMSYREAFEELGEKDILLSIVQFHHLRPQSGNLDELVAASGGYITWASSQTSPLTGIFQRTRDRYHLSYPAPPSSPGARHKIEVRLAKTQRVLEARSRGEVWRLQHRSGYTVSSRPQLR